MQSGAQAFGREVLSKVNRVSAGIAKPEDRWFATRPCYAPLAQAGFVHPLIPESYGGTGLSALDLALAAEALSAVDLNVSTTLLATGLGREP